MKKGVYFLAIAFCLFAAGAAGAKSAECVKDGKKYGVVEGNFREEWYSYQERADSYLAGDCYDAALADFEQAIKLRAAIDRAADVPGCDQRQARSYGMHFLDFFAHRGRGVALLKLGRVDDSIKELEFSLQCVESSQAQFYLDQARAKRLQSSGGDVSDPKIKSIRFVLAEPKVSYVREGAPAAAPGYDRFLSFPYYYTQEEIVAIREGLGNEQARDKNFVKSIKPGWGYQVISWRVADELGDRPVKDGMVYVLVESEDDQGIQYVAASGARSPYTFAQKTRLDVFPLMLNLGAAGAAADSSEDQLPQDLSAVDLDISKDKVSLEFTVTDLLGKIGKKTVALAFDQEGPQLPLEEVKILPGGKALLRGRVDEPSGLARFTIGGVTPKNLGGGRFEVEAPLESSDRVRFEAVDTAGNATVGVLVVGPTTKTGITPPERWARFIGQLFRVAALDGLDPAPAMTALPPRPGAFSGWAPPDNYETPIRVAVDVELYWNELQATMGTAKTPPKITMKTRPQTVYTNQVYVEGTAVGQGANLTSITVNGKNVIPGPRTNAFFNRLLFLRPGKNQIEIKATDANGLVTVETLVITQVVPKVRSVSERLAVSMLPFYQDPTFVDIGEVAYDNLATALIQQRRFAYVDRSKVEAVLRELRLSGAGLTDPNTAVRAGKQSASEAIIIGTVRETPTSIEVKTQVVDVETSRIMVTRDAYHQDKSLENLRFITRGLAVKLQNAFPIVQGSISRSEGRNVVISLGRANLVMPGMRVVFFKVIPKTDANGQPVGSDTQKIGEGKIDAISSTSSNVEVTVSKGTPAQNDLVITK